MRSLLRSKTNLRNSFVLTLFLIIVINVAGCTGASMWTDRATNPVIMDGQNPGPLNPAYYGVISTTAGRRSIFIGYKNPDGSLLKRPAICAEPPPDAIDALANAITISAAGKGGGASPEVQAQLANSIAVSSALGLYRSQGLQFLRDQTFQLCIRAMVVNMDPEEWKTEQAALINAALPLIKVEMPAIETAANRWSNVVVAPPSPFPGGNAGGAKPVEGATPSAASPLATSKKQPPASTASGGGSWDIFIRSDSMNAGERHGADASVLCRHADRDHPTAAAHRTSR